MLQNPLQYGKVLEQVATGKNDLPSEDVMEVEVAQTEREGSMGLLLLPLRLMIASLSKKEIVEAFLEDMFSHTQKCLCSSMEEVVLGDPA